MPRRPGPPGVPHLFHRGAGGGARGDRHRARARRPRAGRGRHAACLGAAAAARDHGRMGRAGAGGGLRAGGGTRLCRRAAGARHGCPGDNAAARHRRIGAAAPAPRHRRRPVGGGAGARCHGVRDLARSRHHRLVPRRPRPVLRRALRARPADDAGSRAPAAAGQCGPGLCAVIALPAGQRHAVGGAGSRARADPVRNAGAGRPLDQQRIALEPAGERPLLLFSRCAEQRPRPLHHAAARQLGQRPHRRCADAARPDHQGERHCRRQGQAVGRCQLGARRRSRPDLCRRAAGRQHGHRRSLVAARLRRAAARVVHRRCGEGARAQARRHGQRQCAGAGGHGDDRQPAQGQLAKPRDEFRDDLLAQRPGAGAAHPSRDGACRAGPPARRAQGGVAGLSGGHRHLHRRRARDRRDHSRPADPGGQAGQRRHPCRRHAGAGGGAGGDAGRAAA